ncbi:MAG: hypothetical protein JXA90_13355, partial [Planctomycetes bacterium]|nr:hypothetical protein [Planctomycetota bacterium]
MKFHLVLVNASIVVSGLVMCPLYLRADAEWPQWRGPNRDDISSDKGLLTKWPSGGPALVWKATGLGGG